MFPLEHYSDLVAFYGKVGENQVTVESPYPMRIAWETSTTINKFQCHGKIKDSLRACLEGIQDLYNGDLAAIRAKGMDLYGGCLNVRKKRNSNNWSTHAWGIAIDLDPENNRLSWDRKKATMPEDVIKIFLQNGWFSLGESKNYDFMHFQAARI